ncbi:subtilisin-like protease SBT5.4 [Prunus yedoensis var. nudiflora]|uniref:Subtilisin-like protease SBT5.4 n=2 Tax=Prunus TaxID=3754 RepID=A0A314Y6Y8_PRUYE|nr:subtilisin-like protease SBT5.4 [Prunus yedoensis var. nudiflora]
MVLSTLPSLLLPVLLFFLLQTPTLSIKKSFIVYLGAHSHGPDPSSVDLDSVRKFHYDFLGSFLRSNKSAKDVIFYSYTRHINGFAAILEEEEAADIAEHPNVISVFLNKGSKLETTRSWNFLGLERNGLIPSHSIWMKARLGEDTIIANIDTGVWPESKSFSDEGLGPVPSKWRGICQHDTKRVRCNRKLIGTRYFNNGLAMYAGPLNSSFSTARDYDGHGSHTLATAAGNFVPGVSVFGNGNGTAKGGSPRARVAAYKVCWPPYEGAFHAVKHGIVVVSAAGNTGPNPGTVLNLSPWLLTVGAGTIDREFTSYVSLGNKKHLKGVSLSAKGLPSEKFYPLVSAAEAKHANASTAEAIICQGGTLDPRKVKGKILVCLREYNDNARTEKSWQADMAGAVGMILVNDEQSGNDVVADPHVLLFHMSTTLTANISSITLNLPMCNFIHNRTPMAYLTRVKTELGSKPAPFVATFSSRGPNLLEQGILKPDIIAPGVSIIAAYTEAAGPTSQISDTRRVPFNVQTGSSMSCPHASGIAGLLRTLHPDWSPAAIKSAIMTTATTQDDSMEPILDDSSSYVKATPFAYGSGHIQPNKAMDPGLIYNLTTLDYLNFLLRSRIQRNHDQIILQLNLQVFKVIQPSRLQLPFNCNEDAEEERRRSEFASITHRVQTSEQLKMQSNEAPVSMEVEAVPSEPSSAAAALPPKPIFEPLKAHEMSDGRVQFRKVSVPPHRYSPLKKVWMDIYTPVYEQMKIDIRMNLKGRKVELKTRADTPDVSNLQKCSDFVQAFMLGFDVIDAIALLRMDELYVESFEIKDVKTLRGEHLSRAIGRLSGKGGKTKFAIENATKTRIVIADTKIHILGSFANIKVARDSLCSLILGSPAGKVYSKLRAVTARLAERF